MTPQEASGQDITLSRPLYSAAGRWVNSLEDTLIRARLLGDEIAAVQRRAGELGAGLREFQHEILRGVNAESERFDEEETRLFRRLDRRRRLLDAGAGALAVFLLVAVWCAVGRLTVGLR